MYEDEWIGSTDAFKMLEHLRFELWSSAENIDERKQRLFACACCRRIWELIPHEIGREAILIAEAHADDHASESDIRRVTDSLRDLPDPYFGSFGRFAEILRSEAGAESMVSVLEDHDQRDTAALLACYSALLLPQFISPIAEAARSMTSSEKRYEVAAEEQKAHCDLIREIFGNPFRHREFDARWKNETTQKLARSMYDDRTFQIMPILGDAIEEAGCTDDTLLSHCRDEGITHVRGCWVVDSVLGF